EHQRGRNGTGRRVVRERESDSSTVGVDDRRIANVEVSGKGERSVRLVIYVDAEEAGASALILLRQGSQIRCLNPARGARRVPEIDDQNLVGIVLIRYRQACICGALEDNRLTTLSRGELGDAAIPGHVTFVT